MKKLIIYYSLEGSTKAIGEVIAKTIQGDVLELKPKKDIKSKGLMKYIIGGKKAVMKEETDLYPLEKDPNEYDVIFIGTPVWAGTFAPSIRSFFNKVQLKNKKLALFCCHNGGKGNTFDNMKKFLPENEFIGEMDFVKVWKNKNSNENLAKEWSHKITKE